MDKYVDNPLVRLTLVVLSTLRLTRFVTSDFLGEWAFVGKAKAWAWTYEADAITARGWMWDSEQYEQHGPITWQAKLVKGLDCPFCVGFWIGGLVIAGELLTRTRLLRWARPIWTFALAMLSLNEVVGHVSSRIDG